MDIEKSLNRIFSLGETHWMQEDSESYSQNKKADLTYGRFTEAKQEIVSYVFGLSAQLEEAKGELEIVKVSYSGLAELTEMYKSKLAELEGQEIGEAAQSDSAAANPAIFCSNNTMLKPEAMSHFESLKAMQEELAGEDIRTQFHAWASDNDFEMSEVWSSNGEPFESQDTQLAWEIWQASRAFMPKIQPKPAETEKCNIATNDFCIKKLAEFVIEHSIEYDCSGSRSHHGLQYCVDCGVYEQNGKVDHKEQCLTNFAEKIISGTAVKLQRITEQDAREIVLDYLCWCDSGDESSFNYWLNVRSGSTLLAKLNEKRQCLYDESARNETVKKYTGK